MKFYKYHGAGNDFILLDGFEREFDLSESIIKLLCHRRLGIGSDGLIIVKPSEEAHFKMDYYNPDGSSGMMCGNGARSAIMLAASKGYVEDEMTFLATDGIHRGVLHDEATTSLTIPEINEVKRVKDNYFVNSGAPHLVLILNEGIEEYPVEAEGRKLRNDSEFQPSGTNVNFIQKIDSENYDVRTYERGVEKETLACGTGVTASAIVAHYAANKGEGHFSYRMNTRTAPIQLDFQYMGDEKYSNIWLKGPVQKVFEGDVKVESLSWQLNRPIPYIQD